MNNKLSSKDLAAQHDSISELLVQLAKSSAVVVHDEIELVIQRIHEKVKAVRSGALLLATGVIIGFAALLCFCAALIIGLTSYMSPVIASLVTGAAFSLVGIIIAFMGYRQLNK